MKKKNTEMTPNGQRVALKDKEQRHQMDSTGRKSPTTPMHFTLSCPDKKSSSYKISPSDCVVQFNGILQSCHQWPNDSHAFWERDLQQLVPAPRRFASLSAQENVLLSLAVISRVSSSISPRLATSQSIPSVVLAVRSQFGSFHILSSTWAH